MAMELPIIEPTMTRKPLIRAAWISTSASLSPPHLPMPAFWSPKITLENSLPPSAWWAPHRHDTAITDPGRSDGYL